MSTYRRKVAIVGAGPAGASTALFLKDNNVDITVFERQTDPGPVGAGIMLQTSGLRVLKDLDVLPEIDCLGKKITRFKSRNRQGKTIFDINFSDLKLGYFGVGIHRSTIFKSLYDQVIKSSVNVQKGVDVCSFKEHNDQVILLDETDTEIGLFDLVIVANGSRNPLRQKLDITKFEKQQPVSALWVKVPSVGEELDRTMVQVYSGTDKMLGMMPIGIDSYSDSGTSVINYFWGATNDYLKNWSPKLFKSWKKEALALAPEYSDITNRITDFEQVTCAPYFDVKLKPFYHNSILFIGDAAHAMSPHLSSGTNLALLDAKVFGECYSDQKSVKEIFEDYQSKRAGQIYYYQWASRLVTPLFQSPKNRAWLRDIVLKTAYNFPLSKGLITKTITGTRYNLFKNLPDKYSL